MTNWSDLQSAIQETVMAGDEASDTDNAGNLDTVVEGAMGGTTATETPRETAGEGGVEVAVEEVSSPCPMKV